MGGSAIGSQPERPLVGTAAAATASPVTHRQSALVGTSWWSPIALFDWSTATESGGHLRIPRQRQTSPVGSGSDGSGTDGPVLVAVEHAARPRTGSQSAGWSARTGIGSRSPERIDQSQSGVHVTGPGTAPWRQRHLLAALLTLFDSGRTSNTGVLSQSTLNRSFFCN